MKFTRFFYLSSIAIFLLFVVVSIIAYILAIVALSEFIFYFLFCLCSAIALFILKDDDPIGHLLKKEKYKLDRKKILSLSILCIIVGLVVMFNIILIDKNAIRENITSTIFAICWIVLGSFGILSSIYKKGPE